MRLITRFTHIHTHIHTHTHTHTHTCALAVSFFLFFQYNDANIQLLDLPGIIEGAAQGKGRGRQVISVARTADLILMMLDAIKGDVQRCEGWDDGMCSRVLRSSQALC